MANFRVADRVMCGGTKVNAEFPKATETNGAYTMICVVDDDESVRDSFRTLLESHGFTVTTYASGREMLADERHHQAGFLIIDQHMPAMNGLATLGVLRREGSSVPTIMITGRLDAEITEQAATLDVTAILEKPFSTARLIELIRAHRRANQ
jgi:two-component system, LuxR family, response regulator FixJ